MLDFFDKFFGFIWSLYSFPVNNWQGTCSGGGQYVTDYWSGVSYAQCDSGLGFYYEPDKLIALISGLIIYGITFVLLGLVVASLHDCYVWRRDRERCQVCNKWTTNMGDETVVECRPDKGCCEDCHETHLDLAVERRAAAEPVYNCPACQIAMIKQIQSRLVLDVCVDGCGGVFLSPSEFKEMGWMARSLGRQEGEDAYRHNGMLVGIAIGSALN